LTTADSSLVLARHGQASPGDSSQSRALTELGRFQATAAGEWAAPLGIARAVASETPRARDTAALIAPRLEVQPEPGLAGLRIGGDETPLSGVDSLAIPFRDPQRRPPGGESLVDLQERSVAALRALVEEGPTPVLAVAHRFVCTVVVARALAVPLAGAEVLVQDPGAVNLFSCGAEPAVGTVNLTAADPLRLTETGLLLPDSDTAVERRRYLLAEDGNSGGGAEEALRSALAGLDRAVEATVEALDPERVAAECVDAAGLGSEALGFIPAPIGSVAILDGVGDRWYVRALAGPVRARGCVEMVGAPR
jgi:broad specificity phosphatase PhoE